MPADDSEAELLAKFQAAIADLSVADLSQLTGDLTSLGAPHRQSLDRPELRRPPHRTDFVYRIRVDLDGSQPPIWRRLDIRSSLSLDVVHQVLQAAFDWTDSHLHRFSLGGGAFEPTSQLFLCPQDIDSDEWDFGDEGVPAAGVRLDEVMQDRGDVLHYLYDYGDNWELTLRLEEIGAAEGAGPVATVVDGRRAAPPEDCGGRTDATSLSEVLEDPARFDLDAANDALRAPYFVFNGSNIDPRLIDIVYRLQHTSVGTEIGRYAQALANTAGTEVSDPIPELKAYQWFLDRALDGGIELTGAGYMKPADVRHAAMIVPATADWIGIGKSNRESHLGPLLEFRQALQSIGLLRKAKGRLVLTRAGIAAQRNAQTLWDHIAARIIPTKADDFETEATLLLLLLVATEGTTGRSLGIAAAALSELGWRHTDGSPVNIYVLYRLASRALLVNMVDRPITHDDRDRFSPAASALARAALRHD